MKAGHYPKVYLYRRIVQAKLFIDNNYAEGIDLNNISQEACFSKFHFIRLFKKIYHKTPHQYLMSVRMEQATRMLCGEQSISEICFAVGFERLSSFCGLFKRLVGCSPSEYRLQQQMLKEQVRMTPLKFIPGCFAGKNGWAKKSNFEEALP